MLSKPNINKVLRWFFGLLILLSLPSITFAENSPTFESLWAEANAKPDHQTIDEERDIRIEVPSEKAIYFFTKEGQPEHPGVFKRSVIQEGKGIYIRTDGWSFGDASARVAFEKLLGQFKAQDAQMRQGSH